MQGFAAALRGDSMSASELEEHDAQQALEERAAAELHNKHMLCLFADVESPPTESDSLDSDSQDVAADPPKRKLRTGQQKKARKRAAKAADIAAAVSDASGYSTPDGSSSSACLRRGDSDRRRLLRSLSRPRSLSPRSPRSLPWSLSRPRRSRSLPRLRLRRSRSRSLWSRSWSWLRSRSRSR